MEIYFEKSFEKDLRSIDNKKLLKKVKDIYSLVQSTRLNQPRKVQNYI